MIFISYSWEDCATTEVVEASLVRMGLAYWIDKKHLNISNNLLPQISQAICQSHQVLCIRSEASRLSPWVHYELKIALKFGKKILELDATHKCFKPNNALHTDKLLASLLVFR